MRNRTHDTLRLIYAHIHRGSASYIIQFMLYILPICVIFQIQKTLILVYCVQGEWNLYGAQPMYMNLEADGRANAAFLLNSNAMGN